MSLSTEQKQENTLMVALQHFEATEANLSKLERVWKEIKSLVPDGASFDTEPDYDNKCRVFNDILSHLPKIDEWKPKTQPKDLNEIAQSRLDAQEISEISVIVSVEEEIERPGKELEEYRFRFNKKRKELINSALSELVPFVDSDIVALQEKLMEKEKDDKSMILIESLPSIADRISQIDTLLGSSIKRPRRWSDLQRHLSFAQEHDFADIVRFDWSSVKKGLQQVIYEADNPTPVEVDDLAELTKAKPAGPVSRKLHWENLNDEQFERLIYMLLIGAKGYENPQWLTSTNAPDRGRDLSVEQIIQDPLATTKRFKVIVQCRHWLTKSISIVDVATLKEQMKLHEHPSGVDTLIIATSGRFTSDAVNSIEIHNQSDTRLRIDMWAETHLETLLASSPHLIAEFGLRK